MRSAPKKYNTLYKKGHVERDMYLPRLDPKGVNNPLEQIMRMDAADGGWRVETTTEKLAQRLGRSIKKAKGGTLAYKWGHNNKFVRVVWETKERTGAKR